MPNECLRLSEQSSRRNPTGTETGNLARELAPAAPLGRLTEQAELMTNDENALKGEEERRRKFPRP
jgi:hypothetical protein